MSTFKLFYNQTGMRQISFDGLEGNRSTGMGTYGTFHFYNELEGFFIENVFEYTNSFDQVSVIGTIVNQTFDGGETWIQSEIIEPLGVQFSYFPQRSIGYGYNPNTRKFYTIRKK